jgi:phosphotriesterase-related protein
VTTVTTVLGPVSVTELGTTLMHEHLTVDATAYVWDPPEPWKTPLRDAPVTPHIAWMLREDPFCSVDNCLLDDVDAVVEELRTFLADDGRTIVDPTCEGMGRRPDVLVDVSERTGLHVVMGAGWYIGRTHSDEVRAASVQQLTEHLLRELTEGVDGTGVRPGILGELGVSADFTDAEQRCLRGAARAQASTGLPLMVHLPGWDRYGHRVLDVAEAEGVDPNAVILCHMNPSGGDTYYQRALAERGAWLEFDMTGMGFYYADQDGQSPSPDDDARAVARLVERGHAGRVLLSHDVFVKIMWTRHGGNGFSFIQRLFLPRLQRLGVDQATAESLLIDNPREVFTAAARTVAGVALEEE